MLRSPLSEPVWYEQKTGDWWSMNDRVRDWVYDESSLTQRLIQHSRKRFRVEVIAQYYQQPTYSEGVILSETGMSYIREVLLYCDKVAVVYAKTVIPLATLKGKARHLVTLGTRPLGAVLFADPLIVRETLQAACLSKKHALYQRSLQVSRQSSDKLWARRTRFLYANSPLLVNEIYLPSLRLSESL